MKKIAVFPGSFDPITIGHLDIIKRGLKIFDKIFVAISYNQNKKSLFTQEEKFSILKETLSYLNNVTVIKIGKELTIDTAHRLKAKFILRGIRSIQDYEYEKSMMIMNNHLSSDVETFFLLARSEYSHISSSLLKEILMFGGDVHKYLPPQVFDKFKKI